MLKDRSLLDKTGLEGEGRYLFHGDALRGRDDLKLLLKDMIQKHVNIRITDTRLLCRLDPLNSTNFHRYIDHKEHIVLVIKLINGFHLAGYYEGSFKPKTASDK